MQIKKRSGEIFITLYHGEICGVSVMSTGKFTLLKLVWNLLHFNDVTNWFEE